MPRPMKTYSARPPKTRRLTRGQRLFAAEIAYADSMVRWAVGDHRGSLAGLEEALDAAPTCALEREYKMKL